jgi:hypothetical protein
MTNDAGTTAISPPEPSVADTAQADQAEAAADGVRPDESDGTPSGDDAPAPLAPVDARLPGALTLAGLSLIWLAGTLWTARATIRSAGDAALAIFLAAYSLPAVISASLVAGAAVGLAVGSRLPDRARERPSARSLASTGTGLLTGLAAAATVTLTYGDGSAIMVLGGTVAAAATVGGAVASLREATIVGAAVGASLAVFVVSVLFQPLQDELMSLYGAGDSTSSQESARGLFAATVALASALVAGSVAYRYLRRATRGAGRHPRWPAYLGAGAGAGLMLLLTEVIIRIAGGPVLSLARSLSEIDATGLAWLDGSRINYGLVVLFVGAITALVAFGRTMPKPGAGPDVSPRDDAR